MPNQRQTPVLPLMLKSAATLTLFISMAAWSAPKSLYEITLTNLTTGQPMAPLLVSVHKPGSSFFTLGQPGDDELAALAEAGDGQPMKEKLMSTPGVLSAVVGEGGTAPGGSSSLLFVAKPGDWVSVGAMLGNTNDAFIAVQDMLLPNNNQTLSYMAAGYDAGTETNDESCNTVPGPACGGDALSPDDMGEGFVSIHNGIHGIGGLSAAQYDWRNPTAKITIKHIR